MSSRAPRAPDQPWVSLPPRSAAHPPHEGAGPALGSPRDLVGFFFLAGSVSWNHLDSEEEHQELFES